MKNIILLWLLFAAMCLSGCAASGKPSGKMLSAYPATSTVQYANKNAVSLGMFTYSANEGRITNLFANEFATLSMENFLRMATAKELSRTGLKIDSTADIVITGDVTKMGNHGASSMLSVLYEITYTISQKSTGRVLFSRKYAPAEANAKNVGTLANPYHVLIAQGYTMFATDPDVRVILDAPPTP